MKDKSIWRAQVTSKCSQISHSLRLMFLYVNRIFLVQKKIEFILWAINSEFKRGKYKQFGGGKGAECQNGYLLKDLNKILVRDLLIICGNMASDILVFPISSVSIKTEQEAVLATIEWDAGGAMLERTGNKDCLGLFFF